jgi:two-component system phosphate regulon sensor histidine kinase PhoR
MPRFGIRRRVLYGTLLVALLGVLFIAGRLYGAMRATLDASLEAHLHGELAWVLRTVEPRDASGGLATEAEMAASVARLPHDADTVYALRRGDGTVLSSPPTAWPPGAAPSTPARIALARGNLWRGVAVTVPSRDGPLEVAVYGRAVLLDDAQETLFGLVAALACVAFAAMLIVTGHAARVLHRALSVLEDTARNFAQARGRGRAPEVAPELGVLTGSLNALAESFEQTVATLAAERDRFEAVLEGLSDAVIAVDDEHRLTLVNRSALNLFELEHLPLGRPLVEVVRVPMLLEVLDRLRREPAVKAEVDWPGARRRRLLLRGGRLRSSGGSVLVLQDLTALRRLETVRRDFVANVSHELRTPVGVILASAETLLDGALDDREHARGFVEALHRNAERLTRLVADLLDLSRIEAGQFQMRPVELDLHMAVERVIDQLLSKAERRGTTLVNRVPPGTRAQVDSKALDQVLYNLTDNAIKYSPDGSHIVAGVRASGPDHLRIFVEDDGPGIEPAHRERVFERFYRVDPGRSREMGGTGLGLSIVKHLVEHMGGTVGVEAVQPKGARFHFTVPVPDARAAEPQSSRVTVQ